jgi:hypothetical protein
LKGRNPPTNLGDFRPESVLVRAPDRRSGPSATRHCFARRRRRPPGSVTRHGQKVPKDHSPSNSHRQHPPTPLFCGPQTPRFRRNEGQNRGCPQRHPSRHTSGPSVATHSSSEPPIPANAGEERRPPPRGEPHTAGNEGTNRRLHFCWPRLPREEPPQQVKGEHDPQAVVPKKIKFCHASYTALKGRKMHAI